MMCKAVFVATFAAIALALAAAPAAAEPMAAFGEYDIGRLMESARQTWNMSELDAVILLDSENVSLDAHGSRTTRVHRIVWMATEYALEEYGDLRVPWNTETSEFRVLSLRTWRDGRWWPHESEISETAVVQTLPHAVGDADDYTVMRETMLLHDGIELPCIVETAYEITMRPPGATGGGNDVREPDAGPDGEYGMWTFTRAEPCVLSRYAVRTAAGSELRFDGENGAPDPTTTRTTDHDVQFTWEMRGLGRLPRPLIADPASEAPHIVWSTWGSWSALAAALLDSFDGAAVLTGSLRDSVAALVKHEPLSWSRAEAVAGFMAETTRLVDYPCVFWERSPRKAGRTWETAYGHRLDRAVLAAALLREAGCTAEPIYATSANAGRVLPELPSLARFEGVSLLVTAGGIEAVYDPGSSTLEDAREALRGRVVWAPREATRAPAVTAAAAPAELEIAITLKPEDDGWSGSAAMSASHALSPHAGMLGLANEARSYLNALAASMLEGADVTDWSIVEFSPEHVVCGFSFDLGMGEPDGFGRTRMQLGSPDAGILGRLPGNAHLYASHRDSPVLLASPLSQRVTLHLDPGDLEIVRAPEPASLTNAVGGFELTVERENDGSLTLTRSIRLDSERIGTDRWPDLRALLLAETQERNGTILLR